MGKTNLIQKDFLAGEISPRLEMQDDLEGRKRGVDFMENWDVHLQGSAETSPGSVFIEEEGEANCRLFPLRITPYTSLMVVALEGLARVYDVGGRMHESNIIDDPYFQYNLYQWDQDVTSPGYITSLYGAAEIRNGSGAAKLSHTFDSKGAQEGDVRAQVYIPELVGSALVTISIDSGATVLATQTADSPGMVEFDAVVPADSYYLGISIEASTPDSVILVTSAVLAFVTGGPAYVEETTSWTSGAMDTMQSRAIPGSSSILIASRSSSPYVVEQDGYIYQEVLTGTPLWSAGEFPNAIFFYGGRLWMGGSVISPSTFWASTTGDFYDFTVGATDSDGIEATLDDGGLIEWIDGAQGRGLLIGTTRSEHSIYAGSGVLTPSDIATAIQSTYGSATDGAVQVGSQLAFLTSDGRKVRNTEYTWKEEVWKSRDLTYASEHITGDRNEIKHLVYETDPDSRITGVTNLGTLIHATYDTYTGAIGFSRRTTEGRVVCIATAPTNKRNEIWWIVDRGDSTPLYCLERIVRSENIKLDSHVILSSTSPITGGTVPHLEGKTCQVLVDGAIHPDVTPGAGGVFEIEYGANEIRIGLQIYSTLITLPVSDSLSNVGTTRTMRKRFTEIWVRILESWRPRINGYRPPNRRPSTLMGEVEEARTENVKVQVDGWDMDAQITIDQDLPLKTELAGWFGRIIQEEI